MRTEIRALIFDESDSFRESLGKSLFAGHRGIVESTSDLAEATEWLREREHDLCVFEYRPDLDGFSEFLSQIESADPSETAIVVIARENGHKDPEYLMATIIDEHITLAVFVPSMLELFLAELPSGADLKYLRGVIASGEALTPDLVDRFHQRLQPAWVGWRPRVQLWRIDRASRYGGG